VNVTRSSYFLWNYHKKKRSPRQCERAFYFCI